MMTAHDPTTNLLSTKQTDKVYMNKQEWTKKDLIEWETDISYLQRRYETCRCKFEKSSIWYLIFDLQKQILYYSAIEDCESAVKFLENSRPKKS